MRFSNLNIGNGVVVQFVDEVAVGVILSKTFVDPTGREVSYLNEINLDYDDCVSRDVARREAKASRKEVDQRDPGK